MSKNQSKRGNKKGGKTPSRQRKGMNTKVHLLECDMKNRVNCKC